MLLNHGYKVFGDRGQRENLINEVELQVDAQVVVCLVCRLEFCEELRGKPDGDVDKVLLLVADLVEELVDLQALRVEPFAYQAH